MNYIMHSYSYMCQQEIFITSELESQTIRTSPHDEYLWDFHYLWAGSTSNFTTNRRLSIIFIRNIFQLKHKKYSIWLVIRLALKSCTHPRTIMNSFTCSNILTVFLSADDNQDTRKITDLKLPSKTLQGTHTSHEKCCTNLWKLIPQRKLVYSTG